MFFLRPQYKRREATQVILAQWSNFPSPEYPKWRPKLSIRWFLVFKRSLSAGFDWNYLLDIAHHCKLFHWAILILLIRKYGDNITECHLSVMSQQTTTATNRARVMHAVIHAWYMSGLISRSDHITVSGLWTRNTAIYWSYTVLTFAQSLQRHWNTQPVASFETLIPQDLANVNLWKACAIPLLAYTDEQMLLCRVLQNKNEKKNH